MQRDLALDALQQRALHDVRRGEDLAIGADRPATGGQIVEQLGEVAADLWIAGQKTEVGIQSGRPGVVVAGADVGVAPEAVVIAADDEDQLAVGLQAQHAVGDVDADFFQARRPLDVGGLVEARLQFDDDGDLFALPRRLDQQVDDLRVRGGPVEGHLDGQDLRVVGGFANEPGHRGDERLVRVLQQDRAVLPDDVEDVVAILEMDVGDRFVRGIVQLRNIESGQLHQVAHADHHVGFVDVAVLVQAQFGGQHAPPRRIDVVRRLQANDGRELAVAQLGLDHREQIVGRILVALGVGIAGDPEQLDGADLHPRKQVVDAVGHHVFQRDEPPGGADPDKSRHPAAHRHLDARQRDVRPIAVAQRHQEVERQIRHERERVRRVDGQRGHQGEHVVVVVGADDLALVRRQIGEGDDADVVFPQVRHQTEVDHALPRHEIPDHGAAFVELLRRCPAVDGELVHSGAELLLQSADAFHEELVGVRGGNRQEFHPFEQRRPRIMRLGEDPGIEPKPGQLPVQVELRRSQVDRRRGAGAVGGDASRPGGRFDSRPGGHPAGWRPGWRLRWRDIRTGATRGRPGAEGIGGAVHADFAFALVSGALVSAALVSDAFCIAAARRSIPAFRARQSVFNTLIRA